MTAPAPTITPTTGPEQKAPYHVFRADPNSQLNQTLGVLRNVEGRATEILKVSALLVPAIGAFLLFFEDQNLSYINWITLIATLSSISYSIWCALHCMRHFSVVDYIVPDNAPPEERTDLEWARAFRSTLARSERSVERTRHGQMTGIVFLLLFVTSMSIGPILSDIQ